MKIYFIEQFIEDCGQGNVYFEEDEAKQKFIELRQISLDEAEDYEQKVEFNFKIFEAEVKESDLAKTL